MSCAGSNDITFLRRKIRSEVELGFQRRNGQYLEQVFNQYKDASSQIRKEHLSAVFKALQVDIKDSADIDKIFEHCQGAVGFDQFKQLLQPLPDEQWANELNLPQLLITTIKTGGIAAIVDDHNIRALSNDEISKVSTAFGAALNRVLSETSRKAGEAQLPKSAVTSDPQKIQAHDEHDDGVLTVQKFLKHIVTQCKKTLTAHEARNPKDFAQDEIYRTLVTEMLEVQTMALSKFEWWKDDESQKIREVYETELREAYRGRLSFEQRTLPTDIAERKQKAFNLCKMKGLLTFSDLDMNKNDLGESKIVSASAEGLGTQDLKLLVWAGYDLKTIHTRYDDKEKQEVETGTALMCAADNGNEECIRALVELKSDVNQARTDGRTAIFLAAFSGHADCIKVLKLLEADVNKADNAGFTALLIAAQQGHSDCIRELKQHDANVNAKNNKGLTALHLAAEAAHGLDCLQCLVELKANVNQKKADGKTPLHQAAIFGRFENIEFLIKKKAEVNACCLAGTTPVLKAAENGHEKCIKLLHENRADVFKPKDGGWTPMLKAARNAHGAGCIKVLADLKVDVNQAKKNGTTPLYVAAESGRFKCVKALLELGALDTLEKINGLTPLEIAQQKFEEKKEKSYEECVKELTKHATEKHSTA